MFPKVQSAWLTPGNTPVYLSVYDLTPMNGYLYWAGFGIFHSCIEGVESFDLDMEQQKVIVKGNVDPEALLKTVSKTGKQTSFWKRLLVKLLLLPTDVYKLFELWVLQFAFFLLNWIWQL